MARRKKAGVRTKSGRLSRAYHDPRVRDHGTPEAQAKRKALVGENGDPTLSATAPGILFSHGYLDKDQYAEAMEYRRLRCMLYGAPWPHATGASLQADEIIGTIKARFEQKVRRLSEEQKRIVTNVCVFDALPTWFFVERLSLKRLPEDDFEQAALVEGLSLLAGQMRKAA